MSFTPDDWHDGPAGGTPLDAEHLKDAEQHVHDGAVVDAEAWLIAQKGAANGIATLDGSSLLTIGQLPTSVVRTGASYSGTIDGGSGTNRSIMLPTPTSGQLLHLHIGTSGSPDTNLAPAAKAVRSISLLSSAVVGDGGEQAAAICGVTTGDAANQVQTVGVIGEAQNFGTTAGSTGSPDACAIYGTGRIDGSGVGVGIGGFFNGMTNTPLGKASGLQVQAYNNSGRTDTVVVLGFPSTAAIWAIAQGPNQSGVGMALGNPFGSQFDVGHHFNGQTGASRVDAGCGTTTGSTTVTDTNCVATDVGRLVTGTNIPTNAIITSVTPGTSFVFTTPTAATATGTGTVSLTLAQVGPTVSADIRSDSNALTSLLIRGAHPTAAIAVAAGAGPTLIGGIARIVAGTLFEVQGPSSSVDPLAMFGSATGNFYTVQLRNGSGQARWFVAAGANNALTGTIAGDTGMAVTTSGKAFHIGGSVSVIRVGQNNSLGFNNAAGVTARTGWTPWTGTPTRTAFATTTATLQNVAEALKALIDDLHATAGYGLLTT